MDRRISVRTARACATALIASAALTQSGCGGTVDVPNNHEKPMARPPHAVLDTAPADAAAAPSTVNEVLERDRGDAARGD